MLIYPIPSPGEVLPPLPGYTHNEHPLPGSGLKPYTTVRDVLQGIPAHAPSHDVHRASSTRLEFEAWNADATFPYTICTAGLINGKTKRRMGHPSGTRDVTSAEVAAIQGVPWYHRFPDPSYKTCNKKDIYKLIGNLYPPLVANHVFTVIREALEFADANSKPQLSP